MSHSFFKSAALGLAILPLLSCEAPKPAAPAAAESLPPAISLPQEISFNEHIQPVLSENCYHCHGPDAGTREPKDAPLRLDRVADA